MLNDVTPAALSGAPSSACEGVFRAFRPSGNTAWVALPAWAKMQGADTAVVLQVADTRTLTVAPAVAATNGPALLVIDRADIATISPENFYLVSRAPSSVLLGAGGKPLPAKLELAAGGALPAGGTVVGRLALVVRPPATVTQAPKNLPPGLRDLGIAEDGEDDADGEKGPKTLGSGDD
jgi:hypothetical protein